MTWKVRGRSSSQTPDADEHADREREHALPSAVSSVAPAPASAGAARAQRLVGDGDEDQHRRADHQQEDAEVEQQRGGEGHLADQRQLDVAGRGWSGTDSRTARRPSRSPPRPEPEADPAHRQDAQPVLDPRTFAAEILQQEGDRQRDAGGEAAARQVVAAQEQIGRQHDDRREHPAHDDRRAPPGSRAACRRGCGPRRSSSSASWIALLLGQADALVRRAEAAQQREDRQRDDAEHGDLAEGVEAAEIDEDDVDDVGAAALGIGVLEEPGRRRRGRAASSSPRRRCRRCRRRRRPRSTRSRAAAQPAPQPVCRRRSPRRRFGSQRRPSSSSTVVTISTRSCVTARSGADSQTKLMQVDEPGAADQQQRREAVVLGLPGGGDGAGRADDPEHARTAGRSPASATGRSRSAPHSIQAAEPNATSTRMRSCDCSRSVPSQR